MRAAASLNYSENEAHGATLVCRHTVFDLSAQHLAKPRFGLRVIQHLKAEFLVKWRVPDYITERRQGERDKTALLRISNCLFQQGASDTRSLSIKAHGKFPNVQCIVPDLRAQKRDRPVVVLHRNPAHALGDKFTVALDGLVVVICDPGKLCNFAVSLTSRLFDVG